MVALCNVCARH